MDRKQAEGIRVALPLGRALHGHRGGVSAPRDAASHTADGGSRCSRVEFHVRKRHQRIECGRLDPIRWTLRTFIIRADRAGAPIVGSAPRHPLCRSGTPEWRRLSPVAIYAAGMEKPLEKPTSCGASFASPASVEV